MTDKQKQIEAIEQLRQDHRAFYSKDEVRQNHGAVRLHGHVPD